MNTNMEFKGQSKNHSTEWSQESRARQRQHRDRVYRGRTKRVPVADSTPGIWNMGVGWLKGIVGGRLLTPARLKCTCDALMGHIWPLRIKAVGAWPAPGSPLPPSICAESQYQF